MTTEEEPDIPSTGAVFTFGYSRFADNVPSHFFIRNDPIADIACGDEHTVVVCRNGRVFSFGRNADGQLGLSHTTSIAKPMCLKVLKPFKMIHVACGRAHTLILKDTGEVFSCGENGDGQLGIGNNINSDTPVQILDLIDVIQVDAGSRHSVALTSDGKVFVWGSNSDGQLGLGETTPSSLTPSLLSTDEKIVQIACGYYHTGLLSESGQVYTFGEGEAGKLGLGDSFPRFSPVKVLLPVGETIKLLSLGGRHSLALTNDGKVMAWGSNESGQLGVGDKIDSTCTPKVIEFFQKKIQSVSSGESHSAFITEDGELFTCGDCRHGKLALGSTWVNNVSHYEPVKVDKFNNLEVFSVRCGGCHTMALARPKQANSNGLIIEHEFSEEPESLMVIENDLTKKPLGANNTQPAENETNNSTKPQLDSLNNVSSIDESTVSKSPNSTSPTPSLKQNGGQDDASSDSPLSSSTQILSKNDDGENIKELPEVPSVTVETTDNLGDKGKAPLAAAEETEVVSSATQEPQEGKVSRFFHRLRKSPSQQIPQVSEPAESKTQETDENNQKKSKMCTIV